MKKFLVLILIFGSQPVFGAAIAGWTTLRSQEELIKLAGNLIKFDDGRVGYVGAEGDVFKLIGTGPVFNFAAACHTAIARLPMGASAEAISDISHKVYVASQIADGSSFLDPKIEKLKPFGSDGSPALRYALLSGEDMRLFPHAWHIALKNQDDFYRKVEKPRGR
jgi:hypothetical protein